MATSSDFNMLRLEAPRDLLQITDGASGPEPAVEIANPAVWVRTPVRQQWQAKATYNGLRSCAGTPTIKWTGERARSSRPTRP